jgi:competence transcription factor ComK
MAIPKFLGSLISVDIMAALRDEPKNYSKTGDQERERIFISATAYAAMKISMAIPIILRPILDTYLHPLTLARTSDSGSSVT